MSNDTPRYRILTVEDDDNNARLIEKYLHGLPIEVYRARTGLDGIELAYEIQPDLILMDIGLPGINGVTTIELIRHAPQLTHIPIIVLSAFGSDQVSERCLSAGCQAVLLKPISRDHLIRLVTIYLKTYS